jgi:hypothetical protein
MLVALGVVLIVLAVLALRKGMSKRAPAV